MLTLLQITTGDKLGDIVAQSSAGRPWVGAMVHAAMGSARAQENYNNMQHLFGQQEALLELWEKLRCSGMRPVFDDPNTMTTEELKAELDDPKLQAMFKNMRIRQEDILSIMQ